MKLFKSDIRICAHRLSPQLLYIAYEHLEFRPYIKDIVINMFKSKDEHVSYVGAAYMTNIFLLYGEFKRLLFSRKKRSKSQIKGILEIAVIYFCEYNESCKNIINIQNFNANENIDEILQLFHDNKIDLNRDSEFVLSLLNRYNIKNIIHSFLGYLKKNSIQISPYIDLILSICEEAISSKGLLENKYYYGLETDLSELILTVFDNSASDMVVKSRCLDIIDSMYKNQIGTIRSLSREMMEQ